TIAPTATMTAQGLTDELRKQAREDHANDYRADQNRELIDEQVEMNCATMIGKCRADITRELGVDHILYGGITGESPHAAHLVLYEVTSDIAVEWTGDVGD